MVLFHEISFPEQVSHTSNISKSRSLHNNFTIPASFNVWDSQIIISAPSTRLGQFHSSALCITLSSGWLHSTAPAVLATYPRVLVSSVGWVLLLQLGLTHSLPMFTQWCQTSAALHENFTLLKQIPPGDSYTWPSTVEPLGSILMISGTHLFHSENTTQKIVCQWCWFLLHHLEFLNYSYPALSH